MNSSCKNCGLSFEITQDDLAFYDRVSPVFAGKKYTIPPPTLCPDCRMQRRFVWRSELHLFRSRSALSGESILSQFPPSTQFSVISTPEWWSDRWDPLDSGRSFDFTRPFGEQYAELLRGTPLMSLSVLGNENSDYINCASWNRNCYLLAGANHNEDCYYGNFVNYCRNCIDCSFIDHCELCYECLDCTKCYNCRYCQNASNCSESAFLMGCRGCRHCFGSVNLAEKEYVFLNEQLTKREYEKRIAALPLNRRSKVSEASAFFERHRLQYPHKEMIGEMNEDISGNGILRSRRAYHCFDVSDLEDCSYCAWFHQSKDCRDCYAWGFPAILCYECTEVGDNSEHVLFSVSIYNGTNILYSFQCLNNCKDCFGCVGMRRKQYCIFNRQYTKEEYEKLVPMIIEHMQRTREWGQMFPMSVCPFVYNQTIAQDYFPITKERALTLGATWNDDAPSALPKTIEPIPDAIENVDEGICEKTLTCAATGKPFKIIPQEFSFYKGQGIPLPDRSFLPRHEARLRKRNPRKLWKRPCMKCKKNMQTSYAPERPETVYCEECYLKEVY